MVQKERKDKSSDNIYIIGASVSEPHTSESNWDFSYTSVDAKHHGASLSETVRAGEGLVS